MKERRIFGTMKNFYLGNAKDCPEDFELVSNAFWMLHLLDVYRGELGVILLDCDFEDGGGFKATDVVNYIVWKNRWAYKIKLYSKDREKRNRLFSILDKGKRGRYWVEIELYEN